MFENDSVPIPDIFKSAETGAMFERCLMCEQYLLADGTPYMIEKSMKHHAVINVTETIFEYALCMKCAMRMHEALSVESRQRIAAYFEKNADLEGRYWEQANSGRNHVEAFISHCLIKKTPLSDSSEYQLVAQCNGNSLVMGHMPFALSIEAMEEMTALMSAKSLGEIDDFIGQYFSGPPEVAALLRRKFVLV